MVIQEFETTQIFYFNFAFMSKNDHITFDEYDLVQVDNL